MLGYIGVIKSWHTADAAAIHREAYSAIHSIEFSQYQALVGAEPPFWFNRDIAQDNIILPSNFRSIP